jgi:hypothetical protein
MQSIQNGSLLLGNWVLVAVAFVASRNDMQEMQ